MQPPSNADATVLALGGASWPRLGSDGGWTAILDRAGVRVAPLKPSNCGFLSPWSEHLRRFAGQPLKRIAVSFGDQSMRGEAIITETGIEGGAIYALSPHLRETIEQDGEATLLIALRPDIWAKELERRLTAPRGKQSISTYLRKALNLSPAEIGLLQEVTAGKLATLPPAELARLINAVPIRLTGVAPIARAISTAGGIAFDELDARFMLRRLPGVFAAGEMLDWEAPTGGYLLQACFATGAAAGRGALDVAVAGAPGKKIEEQPHAKNINDRASQSNLSQVSHYLLQLLQAAHHLRHRRVGKAGLPVRDADLAEIDVALRVERDAVRREEFADLKSRAVLAAEPRDPLALRVHDGQARPEIRVSSGSPACRARARR